MADVDDLPDVTQVSDAEMEPEEGELDERQAEMEPEAVTEAANVEEDMEKEELDVAVEEEEEEEEEELSAIAVQLNTYFPAIQGCRNVDQFTRLNRIEEGTYGVVYRAKDNATEEVVALKRLKMENEKEGFPITSLREISTLLKAPHENIVAVKEIVVGTSMDQIFIVMEYVEHDLKSLMESMKQSFRGGEVKTLMKQLLSAIAHLHDNWILHRDLKTSNLLLNHRGILKVGDFGLAREYGSPLKEYTPVVVTLWYRAPELLLQAPKYSTPIDVWSIGCIFGEFLLMKPLFPGKSEKDQLELLFKNLGTPNEKIWPGYSELPVVKKVALPEQPYNHMNKKLGNKLSKAGYNLLDRLLAYCPERRITAEQALDHEYFQESPLPIDPSMFPSWPAKSEGNSNPQRKVQSPKAPSGSKFAKQLEGDDDVISSEYPYLIDPRSGKQLKGGGFSLKF